VSLDEVNNFCKEALSFRFSQSVEDELVVNELVKLLNSFLVDGGTEDDVPAHGFHQEGQAVLGVLVILEQYLDDLGVDDLVLFLDVVEHLDDL